jgi:hypothetical protein
MADSLPITSEGKLMPWYAHRHIAGTAKLKSPIELLVVAQYRHGCRNAYTSVCALGKIFAEKMRIG